MLSWPIPQRWPTEDGAGGHVRTMKYFAINMQRHASRQRPGAGKASGAGINKVAFRFRRSLSRPRLRRRRGAWGFRIGCGWRLRLVQDLGLRLGGNPGDVELAFHFVAKLGG